MKKMVIFGAAAALVLAMGTAALASNTETGKMDTGYNAYCIEQGYCDGHVDGDHDGICDNCQHELNGADTICAGDHGTDTVCAGRHDATMYGAATSGSSVPESTASVPADDGAAGSAAALTAHHSETHHSEVYDSGSHHSETYDSGTHHSHSHTRGMHHR